MKMEDSSIIGTLSIFEQNKKIDEFGNEYWTARSLAKILQYSEYRHFLPVISKAKKACKLSNQTVQDHFEDILDMVELGSGSKREISDVKLSRYACYLIVQNSDPSKEVVALGQTYFATQTRLAELQSLDEYNNLTTEDEKRLYLRNELFKHNITLASVAKKAGVVNSIDYAVFQNHGYKGLYGGLDAKGIHTLKGLKKSQKILDHMGSTELAANLFRATQTEDKLKKENIKDKDTANKTHFQVGAKIRKTIQELGGDLPETLPTFDDIKKKKSTKLSSTKNQKNKLT
jgi:DNA-damage-inducible protein D